MMETQGRRVPSCEDSMGGIPVSGNISEQLTCLLIEQSFAHRSVWADRRWKDWRIWGGGVGHCDVLWYLKEARVFLCRIMATLGGVNAQWQ